MSNLTRIRSRRFFGLVTSTLHCAVLLSGFGITVVYLLLIFWDTLDRFFPHVSQRLIQPLEVILQSSLAPAPLYAISVGTFMFILSSAFYLVLHSFRKEHLITRMSKNTCALQWHRILFHILIPPISLFFILTYVLPFFGFYDMWVFPVLIFVLFGYIVYLGIHLLLVLYPAAQRTVSFFAGVFLLCISALMIQMLALLYLGNQPRIINDFPLDDTHGRYVISFDGDYWLTYYVDTNGCSKTTSSCNPNWSMIGTAPIYFSPVKLDKYLNVPVSVTAAWQAIYHQIPPTTDENFAQHPSKEYRKFCVQSGLYRECVDSRGPQYWSSSPLLIETIKIK